MILLLDIFSDYQLRRIRSMRQRAIARVAPSYLVIAQLDIIDEL